MEKYSLPKMLLYMLETYLHIIGAWGKMFFFFNFFFSHSVKVIFNFIKQEVLQNPLCTCSRTLARSLKLHVICETMTVQKDLKNCYFCLSKIEVTCYSAQLNPCAHPSSIPKTGRSLALLENISLPNKCMGSAVWRFDK